MIQLGLNSMKPVAEVLKKRFTNLSVNETIELATEIIDAINAVLKYEK